MSTPARFLSQCLLAATLASLTVVGSAAATFPGENGRIGFTRDGEAAEPWSLFTTDPLGLSTMRVTFFGHGLSSGHTDWAPDGRRLVFDISNDATAPQLWISDADGTNPRQLTDAGYAMEAGSTPDGRMLAVEADFGDGTGIFLIPARTRGGELVTAADARRVTSVNDGGWDSEPQVSPNGRWIVFTRFSPGCGGAPEPCETRIFRVRTDGSRLQQLTGPELNASTPDYHPTGRWIVFDTHDNFAAPNAGHIAVMRDDGSAKQVIVRGDEETYNNNPTFSPDGRRLTFDRIRLADRYRTIWVARSDGRMARELLETPTADFWPDWGAKPRGHRR